MKRQSFVQSHVYSIAVFMYNGLVLHNAPWIKGLEPKDNCQRKAIQLTCINVKQTAAEFYKGERERERERETEIF